MRPTKLSIDPEFRGLCQPLTEEERNNLRSLILEHGCDPILVWQTENHPILDGHNRYDICINEGIPFEVRFIKLPDRQAALDLIARIQFGRRNATEEWKAYVRGRMYRRAKKPEGRPPNDGKLGRSDPVLSVDPPKTYGDTATRIGAETGVSARTVKRDAEFSAAVDALPKPLQEAACRGIIAKSAVPALAEAPQKVLDRLEQLEGIELREAARKAAEKPKPGQQKRDPRLWLEIETYLGRALSRLGDLNRAYPHDNLHRAMTSQVKLAMASLRQWKEAAR